MPKTLEEAIDDLVGVFTDPIIVMDPGWGVPDSLREAITMQRLMQVMKGEQGQATEAEALAYLQNASMLAPLAYDWVQIYLYLFTRVWEGLLKKEVPSDLRVDSLDQGQKEDLAHLRAWIWKQRTRGRKERQRAERRAAEAERAARLPEQLSLWDGLKGGDGAAG